MESVCVSFEGYGATLEMGLAHSRTTLQWADVKLLCADSSAAIWAHRLLLAASSPRFLRPLLEEREADDALTLLLPCTRARHLNAALDYLYTGQMFVAAADLADVLRVFESLRMTCGVSVSKMVKVEPAQPTRKSRRKSAQKRKDESRWVEKAQFRGMTELIKDELCHDDIPHGETKEKTKLATLDVEQVESEEEDEELVSPQFDDSAAKKDSFSCIMCGKTFKHKSNLRVHTIEAHLSTKAKLRSCEKCNRHFRSKLEHELHERAHAYSQHLILQRKPAAHRLQRHLVKRLVQKSRRNIAKKTSRQIKEELEAARNEKRKVKIKLNTIDVAAFSCSGCQRTFCSERALKSHAKTRCNKVEIKTDKPKPRKRARNETKTSGDSLTCPTCDKTFLARSILERHLEKSAKCRPAVPFIPREATVGPATSRPASVAQPTMEIGGRTMNKYECHLCGKVFVRVKDLAKHRDRLCSAWLNPK